jgi:hypothetical protein
VAVARQTSLFTGALVVAITAWSFGAHADVAACIAAAERAQPLRASGHLLEARAALITCAADACPTTVRTDCVTWLTEVTTEIPSLVVRAKNAAGEDIVDVKVIADGAPVKGALDGLPIALDPGSHRLRFESPGRSTQEQTVLLTQGERRALALTLLRPDERASPSAPSAPAPPAAEPSPRIPTLSWVLGGASVALAGTGIALWVVGKSEKADLDDGCGTTSSCAHADVVASRTKLVVGDVLVGAGLLALGAGVYVVLSSKRTAPALSLGPNGVVARARF